MRDWMVPGYTNGRELGRSGHGRTVLATHAATGRPVAIRYLADDLCEDPDYLSAFRQDARLVADIESPNIAELYEYVESADGVATVREYVGGASLRQVLPASGLGPAAALTVLHAGLRGLAAAHTHGVTHRGYKPENVLVDAAGEARLADFAVAGAASTPAEDVCAAFATFVECPTGERTPAPPLPGRLRGLAEPAAAGDAPALLAGLDAAGRATAGTAWEAKGRQDLARRVRRSHRRAGA